MKVTRIMYATGINIQRIHELLELLEKAGCSETVLLNSNLAQGGRLLSDHPIVKQSKEFRITEKGRDLLRDHRKLANAFPLIFEEVWKK